MKKHLIYQYWIGPEMEKCAEYGVEAMRNYAKNIGVEYIFERNPTFFNTICDEPASFNALQPVFNEDFHDYDAVLTLDTDIFPVEGIKENIFESDLAEMNICEEIHMPALKQKVGTYNVQERWSKEVEKYYNVTLPKNANGLYKIYNSGLAIYTKEGMRKGKDLMKPIQPFINHFKPKFSRKLFWRDQAYVHAMFVASGLQTRELSVKWNTQIHWEPNTSGKRPVIDMRNKDTRFVHMQLSGSGSWDKQQIWEAVNLPVDLWSFRNGILG